MNRRINLFICFIFVIVISNSPLPAQIKAIRFEHITADMGLSENALSTIYQDRLGFLWFGTHDGLNRYDGYNFRIYRHDPDDRLTISSSLISAIYQDSHGVLWIGTFDRGLNRFDEGRNKFIHYQYQPGDPESLSDNRITTIYEDRHQNLWIGTARGGLNKFNRKIQKFGRFLNPAGDSGNNSSNDIKAVFEDSSGVLWIGTLNGLYIFNIKTERFTRFPYCHKSTGRTDGHIMDITEDKGNRLWIATANGLTRYDSSNGTLTHFQHDPADTSTIGGDLISDLHLDKAGRIWIGLWGVGLDILNPDQSSFSHFRHNPNDRHSLSHNKITRIFQDRSGILWIATEGGGLNKYDGRKGEFIHYLHEPLNKNSLSQNNVTRIYEASSGILWIGTDGKGLNRYDRKKDIFSLFLHDPKDPASISSNYIKSLGEDQTGELWIGTTGKGLNRYNRKNGKFTRYRHDPKDPASIPSDVISDIIKDSRGALWFSFEGGSAGLGRYDRDRDSFTRYYPDPRNPGSIGSKVIIDIFEDREKVLWCGGLNGLHRFNRENGTFTNFSHNPRDRSSLSHNWVWTIFQDSAGRLWVGTYGGGLNLFNRQQGSFIRYTHKNGLANNVIYGILGDQAGNLWISTNKGISKFNPETGRFKNYDAGDGLQGNEFNTGSYCRGRDGRLYFGGTNGLTAFYPDRIRNNPNIPSLVITSCRIFNREINLPSVVAKAGQLFLNHDQNFVSFEFAALDFSIPSKNQYACMMEGIDPDWTYRHSAQRYASYTNLSPGQYVFKVRGSNNDGIWNPEGICLSISIAPPFWQRWWFTVLWIALVGAIIFTVTGFLYRHIVLLKEKAQAERFAVIGKYASFLAHDIKSPLKGIYLIVHEIKKGLFQDREKQAYIDDVIRGIDQIRSIVKGSLDFSKVNKPQLELFNLNQLIEEQCIEFQKLHDCTFDLNLDGRCPPIPLDRSLIKRVFFNLFLNSYQARQQSCEIHITSYRKFNKMVIDVRDNGRGIPAHLSADIFEPFVGGREQGHGIGLAFVAEAIKNHRGCIRVKSRSGQGSTFTITFPVAKKN